MLYVTTKNRNNFHTSYRTLCSDRDEDGGLYVPFQSVSLTLDEINALKEKSFSQCIADILNMYFSARLDAWDVACCMGTQPLKLVPMSHKITIAEIWNNPEWCLSRFVRNLNGRILGNADNGRPSNWMEIAVRIGVIFGIFAKLLRIGVVSNQQPLDISVISGDFTTPIAAWYARSMGLPIGNIVFACNDNGATWDLFHHGEIQLTQKTTETTTPICDVAIPVNIERFIYESLGIEETQRFADCRSCCSTYTISDETREVLCRGMFGAVIGMNRVNSIIRNVYRTNAYILSPYSALAYGGLQDYRATKAEVGQALILTENGPLSDSQLISDTLGIAESVLKDRIRSV